ncbi:MAG: hypothetical protein J0H55_17020 [Chitinophagaceae bacterium]|nr:hypothetical protein [Chitinophagaceae bacterium]
MENSIYKEYPLKQPSFFQKILKQQPEENAIIELNNLLASKPILSINEIEIKAISKKYQLSLTETFPRNIIEFYSAFVSKAVENLKVSDEKKKEIEHLKYLLEIPEQAATLINNEIFSSFYREEYIKVVATGEIKEKDDLFFKKLQNEFSLSDDLAKNISDETRRDFMNEKVKEIIEDGRISPDEEKGLHDLAKGLNIDINIPNSELVLFDQMKLFWALENNPLEMVPVSINLQKGESCYFLTQCGWHELKTETQRFNYAGPTVRFKIMKGVYYRAGSIATQPVKRDVLRLIDTGSLYLTNKRIIFTGVKRNKTIKLNKILSFTPFSDGVEIGKDSGTQPFLSFSDRLDEFGIILSRLINEY